MTRVQGVSGVQDCSLGAVGSRNSCEKKITLVTKIAPSFVWSKDSIQRSNLLKGTLKMSLSRSLAVGSGNSCEKKTGTLKFPSGKPVVRLSDYGVYA